MLSTSLKNSNLVVPVFKKGVREEVSNYRPISVLPFFSKFFEKAMHERLNDYIIKSNIIFSSQHGFQAGHSTFMPLLNMQDKISAAMDNSEYSLGIFLDLAKAFDTIDNSILLKIKHLWNSQYPIKLVRELPGKQNAISQL